MPICLALGWVLELVFLILIYKCVINKILQIVLDKTLFSPVIQVIRGVLVC